MTCWVLGVVMWGAAGTAPDSAAEEHTAVERQIHRTTVAAACVPGAGQILNKQPWKAPLVWGGLGACAWSAMRQGAAYRSDLDALIAETDGDPSTLNPTEYSATTLNAMALEHRRLRDLGWMAFGGVYLLSVVEAHVHAHLLHFDVSESLTASLTPLPTGGCGVSLAWSPR
jgi:hypothetical protein